MMCVIMILVLLYCFAQAIITGVGLWVHLTYGKDAVWYPVYFPSEWYRNHGLNWFGAIVASIGGFIFSPIVYLCRFFSWLCRVGRK